MRLGGSLETGSVADFFTVDLDDLSIAGTYQDELLASIVFGLSKTAIREVGGERAIGGRGGQASDAGGDCQGYNALMQKGSERMSDVVELLRELVSISSVSRESNRGVIDFAESVLTEAGWSFQEHSYRDPAGIEKINLIAWPGEVPPKNGAFHLALVCHTDTVPYGDDWADATTLIEDGDNLNGCGACDVKGYLACILAAAAQIDSARLSKPSGHHPHC